tara:strand:+ start:826 stop:939 length:114 start_codon:yes stop_codon:yes gene_type:complete
MPQDDENKNWLRNPKHRTKTPREIKEEKEKEKEAEDG